LRLLGLIGIALVLGGMLVIVRADDGLVRERTTVDGVPVSVLRPEGDGPFPAVVVAHGFNGSARLMDGIGIALARDGWVAAMPDFAGHGANLDPLGTDQERSDEVAAVADWVAGRPDVGGAAALLGHSMGAGAVTRAATEDSEVPATVALSLPSAAELSRDVRSLLPIVGGAEGDPFATAAVQAAERGYPTVTIPGATHITILFRTETLQRSVTWLDEAVGRPAGTVAPDWRMPAVGAVYLGAALLFWPVSALVVRSRVDAVRGGRPRLPSMLGLVVSGVAAGGVLAVLPALAEVVPLLVGGYLAAFFALAGVLQGLLSRRHERPVAASAVPGVVLGGYAAVTTALPAGLAWAQISLSGPRALGLALLVVAGVAYGWGELLLAWRPDGTVGYARVLVGRLLLSGILLALSATGLAPGFLVILALVMILVLPWLGAYAVRTARLTGSPLAGALTQALPFALLVSVTTPLA